MSALSKLHPLVRQGIAIGLLACAGVSFALASQTVLPEPEMILSDETGRMLSSVKDVCFYYEVDELDTHESCKIAFLEIQMVLNVIAGISSVGVLWIVGIFDFLYRKFSS